MYQQPNGPYHANGSNAALPQQQIPPNIWPPSVAMPSRFPEPTGQFDGTKPQYSNGPFPGQNSQTSSNADLPSLHPYQNGQNGHPSVPDQQGLTLHRFPPSQSTVKLDATEGQYNPTLAPPSSMVPPAFPSGPNQSFAPQASNVFPVRTPAGLSQSYAPNNTAVAPPPIENKFAPPFQQQQNHSSFNGAPGYQHSPSTLAPPQALAPSAFPPPPPMGGPASFAPPPKAGAPASFAPLPQNGGAGSFAPPPQAGAGSFAPPPQAGASTSFAPSPQVGAPASFAPPPQIGGTGSFAPPPPVGAPTSFGPQPPVSLQPPNAPSPYYSNPPQQQQLGKPSTPDPLSLSASFQRLQVQGGVQQVTGDQMSAVNILQFASPADTRLLPLEGVHSEHVRPPLSSDLRRMNASPDVVRCTLNCIPQTEQLLKKSRLPLAIVLHPYKDLQSLALIQSSVIVRCKTCRAYINPFVQFLDQCHYWRCNICGRTNEVPDDFFYDPVSRSQGSPMNRPEVKSATIEFIAPQEYCVRPPQPAVYAFLLDVSSVALQTGYLSVVCEEIKALLDRLPGDKRRQMAFIAFDSNLHVFNLDAETLSQPRMMTLSELDETFLPEPEGLLVNFEDNREMISALLENLPYTFNQTGTTEGSAAGAAILLAQKMLSPTGGRITLFMSQKTNIGPGILGDREPSSSAALSIKQIQSLITEATDFYKKFALDCNSQQIGCDLFLLSRNHADLATLSGASKFSAGSVYYFPAFDVSKNPLQLERFRRQLHRYLLRKVGFEAVLRVRCAKGLVLNSFHGNFFVRSTDLLSLANVNPDAGYAVTLGYEESLADQPVVCFQVAILYTSSKSERRIRVHTLCLPTTNQLSDVFKYADQVAITTLLAKLAVDRSLSDSVSDAREALMSACVDPLASFASTLSTPNRSDVLLVPYALRLLPMLILALLKNPAFSTDGFIKSDDRVNAMEQCRNLPASQLLLKIYPNLYQLNVQLEQNSTWKSFPLLRLSSSSIQRHGLYLMDSFDVMIIFVSNGIQDSVVQNVFDVPTFNHIADGNLELPNLQNDHSRLIRELIDHNNSQRPVPAVLFVIKDSSVNKTVFVRRLVEDKSESGASMAEFLQYIQKELAK